jgi:Winged helix DNA-binding domain
MPTDRLTLRQINRATLARQMLLARERTTPLAAIERLVGLQAQWPRPPFVGLWSRLEAFDRSQLTTLFEQRKVVRATFLRATIHVVTSRDFVALRPAIQPALESAMHGILRERLDGVDLPALTARARALLHEEPQTFEQLRNRFLQADPAVDERAMGYAVRMLLPLVQVPVADATWAFPSQACFAPADTWLGREIPLKATAPDALIQRYLAGYGPASAADVQAWSGLPKPVVREAIERLRPRLLTYRDEHKRELFDLPGVPRPDPDVPAPVRLVPEYDNLITARVDERFVAKANRPSVFLSALRIAATVLVDGSVVGTWKLQATRKAATVTIDPFGPLAARVRKEVTAEAEALARFAEPEASRIEVAVGKA